MHNATHSEKEKEWLILPFRMWVFPPLGLLGIVTKRKKENHRKNCRWKILVSQRDRERERD